MPDKCLCKINLTFGEGRHAKGKRQKAKGSHHEKISPPSMKVVTFKSGGKRL
jgi:hypothetical protein